MKTMRNVFLSIGLVATVAGALSGCTDVDRSKWAALGSPHTVFCVSEGHVLYDGTSTGRVQTEHDVVTLEDASTRELVEIKLGRNASCVIKVKQGGSL